jgi:dTDP-glucose 4,6-dehydratase
VETLLRLMGKPADWYDLVSDRPGHDLRYAIDATKLRDETGWRPEYRDIDAGLEATVAWYREHEEFWRGAKERAEATYARLGR